MATTALTKAIKTLERRKKSDERERQTRKAQNSLFAAQGAATVGVAAAAVADKRMANAGDDVATWGASEVPVNATAGPALVAVGAFLKPGMARDLTMGAGLGLAFGALYRFTYDKVPAPEE